MKKVNKSTKSLLVIIFILGLLGALVYVLDNQSFKPDNQAQKQADVVDCAIAKADKIAENDCLFIGCSEFLQ